MSTKDRTVKPEGNQKISNYLNLIFGDLEIYSLCFPQTYFGGFLGPLCLHLTHVWKGLVKVFPKQGFGADDSFDDSI